jgi:hypothetical protein
MFHKSDQSSLISDMRLLPGGAKAMIAIESMISVDLLDLRLANKESSRVWPTKGLRGMLP